MGLHSCDIISMFKATQKQMKKSLSRSIFLHPSRPLKTGMLLVASLLLVVGGLVPSWRDIVLADQYDAQINALQAQNANTQAAVDGLQAQAASYADAVSKLQTQINSLQASINQNQALQRDLQNQIVAAQQEIDQQRAILASDVKAMYVDGVPSSLELLATSKNLSDFVDKQEYRSRVQTKLQDTLKKIAALQAQLQDQKTKVDGLIKDMQSQQAELDADRAKQQSLLNYNQSQQASYNAQIQANNSKVAQLRAAQAAANAQINGKLISIGTCGGGYPAQAVSPWGGYWGCNYAKDNNIDNWGMYNRECVSYTAFKVYQTYGYMPYWGGHGNANEWPGNARAAGIPTGSTPRVGSVAIWNVGYYGHAMWVEAVNSDGSIVISQYNYSFDGRYSVMRVSADKAASFTYIYFN